MEKAGLVSEFDEAMVEIYRRALAEAKYKASRFLAMVQAEGGLATARYLINAPQVSEGYTALWERKRLDLTVEAIILSNAKWRPLFTSEELERCSERLKVYGYDFSIADKAEGDH
jgi:hypothetical protein